MIKYIWTFWTWKSLKSNIKVLEIVFFCVLRELYLMKYKSVEFLSDMRFFMCFFLFTQKIGLKSNLKASLYLVKKLLMRLIGLFPFKFNQIQINSNEKVQIMSQIRDLFINLYVVKDFSKNQIKR